jgi:hypothetical protein
VNALEGTWRWPEFQTAPSNQERMINDGKSGAWPIFQNALTNAEVQSLLLTKSNEQSADRVPPSRPEDVPKVVIMHERTSLDICSRLLQLEPLFWLGLVLAFGSADELAAAIGRVFVLEAGVDN